MNETNAKIIEFLRSIPPAYCQTANPFWDDEHISKGMLRAHLDPLTDAATRRHSFVSSSADWLAEYCGGGRLLDLGCGPGIYARQLADRGFSVTGLDLSSRSIDYAREHNGGRDITYLRQSYLTLDFEDEFDAVILIYCDYGVLPPDSRRELLFRARRALRSTGVFILDAWNEPYLETYQERERISYEPCGFWSPEPHVLISRSMVLRDTMNTLEQYLVLTESGCKDYNIWNKVYSPDTLSQELTEAGLHPRGFFDDAAGTVYTGKSATLCVTAQR